MSDIKLFHLSGGTATELQGNASDLEKPLQTLIEANLQPLLSIRFIASEHTTGKTHGGRVDSLGLDENHCPVILEYKRSEEVLANLPEPMRLLLASLEDYTFSLGDDVQRKELRLYAAFKRLKNFATVVLHRKNCLLLYLHVDPATALPVLPNARDVTSIGHWGTGNLEVPLTSQADLDAVKPFINAAYEGRG
jgi:predicted transport protein